MGLPLVYLDQNIVSLQSTGVIDLSRVGGVQWVYSKEHFAEISRSENPEPFLNALDQLSARLLDLEMIGWELTGRASVIEYGTAHKHYQYYLDANTEVEIDQEIFSLIIAWFLGGATPEMLREVPARFARQHQGLIAQLPVEIAEMMPTGVEDDLRDMVDSMIEQGNDILRLREMLGVGKGAAGSITGDNPLAQIWERIAPNLAGITAEQFFHFAPLETEKAPPITWLGIIGCCMALDIVGYKAEKKARNPEQVPNILSDAAHIAAGAYCSLIVSRDRRLVDRARAIYRFRGIGTEAAYLELDTEAGTRGK